MTGRQSPELTFTHTRLLVADYPACFRFYRDVLGFDVEWGDEDGGYADFRTGGTTLALFDRAAMADAIGADEGSASAGTDEASEGVEADGEPVAAARQDDVALIFRVESVDDAYRRLEAEATSVTEPHDRPAWGIRVAHLRDPAGTLLEINEPLEEA